MSRGPSGRIVVEIDPALKERLYLALEREGRTFKDWLLGRIDEYLVAKPSAASDGTRRSR